jgi:hypothetical protein
MPESGSHCDHYAINFIAIWIKSYRMTEPLIVTCRKCGAQYERRLNKSTVRDSDSFECSCGEQIEKWSSSVWPSFHKVKDGNPDKWPWQ